MEITRNDLYDIIKKKLLILFTLNISDIAFTLLLIFSEGFQGNSWILVGSFSDQVIMMGIKLAVVAIVSLIINKRINEEKLSKIKLVHKGLNIGIMLLGIFNLLHIQGILIYMNIK